MDTRILLDRLPIKELIGQLPTTITSIAVDSRKVEQGTAFVCLSGYTVDGHDFAEAAIAAGASLLITERLLQVHIPQVLVPNTKQAIGILAPVFFNYPSEKMTMIGVTGTNGKTSVSGIIYDILQKLGEKTASSGTIGFQMNGELFDTDNTTGDVYTTQSLLHQAYEAGCQSMTMEVSSHGLAEGRLAGTDYDIAIFTNLTHDHLDFHGTMANYGEAKSLLFSQLGQQFSKAKFGVVNADDAWGEKMAAKTSYPVFTYSVKKAADFTATAIELRTDGTSFLLQSPAGERKITMQLIGSFSVENALAAIAALYAKGHTIEEVCQALEQIPAIKGRMELVPTELPLTIYIDYAHTPDAIEKAIASVLPYKKNRVLFLIGTGGNRDRVKRPVMGEKASVADYVVFTTDDPRYESYETIVEELSSGMTHPRYACIGDREEAVRHLIREAQADDIIIFAGKGHEDFQIIENTKYPHSDAAIALDEASKKEW